MGLESTGACAVLSTLRAEWTRQPVAEFEHRR